MVLVLVLAVAVGGLLLYRNGAFDKAANPENNDTNINVTIPTPTAPGNEGGSEPQP